MTRQVPKPVGKHCAVRIWVLVTSLCLVGRSEVWVHCGRVQAPPLGFLNVTGWDLLEQMVDRAQAPVITCKGGLGHSQWNC